MKEKKSLIRVVRSPDNTVSLDPTGKKSGRGAYICRNEECLTRALKQKQLERQLQISMTPEISAVLAAELNSMREEADG